MNPFERPGRCCPKCQHTGYMFRARKTIEAPEEVGGPQIETKYRCRSCSHEWRERIPASLVKPPKTDVA